MLGPRCARTGGGATTIMAAIPRRRAEANGAATAPELCQTHHGEKGNFIRNMDEEAFRRANPGYGAERRCAMRRVTACIGMGIMVN